MKISTKEIVGNEIVLEVLSTDHRTNYSDVQAETDRYMDAEFGGENYVFDGASRVGVGITADGSGMGHQARFFVGYQRSEQ